MEQLKLLFQQKFANNDNSVDSQIATIANDFNYAQYEEACKLATHIAWDNKKCQGMAIVMLPTNTSQVNSVKFKGKDSSIIASRSLITGESVTWSTVGIENEEINLMTDPSYTGLASSNNIIRAGISNTIFLSFHPAESSSYITLAVCPDDQFQNSFYSYCAISWQVN